MRFRRVHRWYARRFSYFWLPCPICHRDFGGHEWRSVDGKVSSVPDPAHNDDPPGGPEYAVGICPDCTAAGLGYWRYRLEV